MDSTCPTADHYAISIEVYGWRISRTNIDIDEKTCAEVIRRFDLKTKREAINFALRSLADEPFEIDEARKMRSTGWYPATG